MTVGQEGQEGKHLIAMLEIVTGGLHYIYMFGFSRSCASWSEIQASAMEVSGDLELLDVGEIARSFHHTEVYYSTRLPVSIKHATTTGLSDLTRSQCENIGV